MSECQHVEVDTVGDIATESGFRFFCRACGDEIVDPERVARLVGDERERDQVR